MCLKWTDQGQGWLVFCFLQSPLPPTGAGFAFDRGPDGCKSPGDRAPTLFDSLGTVCGRMLGVPVFRVGVNLDTTIGLIWFSCCGNMGS